MIRQLPTIRIVRGIQRGREREREASSALSCRILLLYLDWPLTYLRTYEYVREYGGCKWLNVSWVLWLIGSLFCNFCKSIAFCVRHVKLKLHWQSRTCGLWENNKKSILRDRNFLFSLYRPNCIQLSMCSRLKAKTGKKLKNNVSEKSSMPPTYYQTNRNIFRVIEFTFYWFHYWSWYRYASNN